MTYMYKMVKTYNISRLFLRRFRDPIQVPKIR